MVYLFDNKEKHFIYKHLSDLHSNKYHSKYYVDVGLGDMHYKCNISISRGVSTEDQEDWYIVSNIRLSGLILKDLDALRCFQVSKNEWFLS